VLGSTTHHVPRSVRATFRNVEEARAIVVVEPVCVDERAHPR
jgi:hypothetical protein